MHRSAKRLASLLACAAVPVMLVAGCSSDDSGKKKDEGGSAAPKSSAPSKSGSASPSVTPAKMKKLPNPCQSVSKDTLKKLVPKTKNEDGEQGKSSDAMARGYCAWKSSDDQGVDGTQYRWLDVGFQRYDSDPTLGSGEKRATDFYKKQVNTAKATQGAKNVKSGAVESLGDEAMWVTYDLKKEEDDFKNQTLIARTANVVVTVNYNGAGLAGADAPDPSDLLKLAKGATQEAVASVAKANQ
ncbi:MULTISPECIES: DUF3558 family protein [Streptomyces]|uniref:DUF3558 family protein n=1 Tax=Streptomyces TaxID=1883 RepID=UPI0004CD770F|nr:MULTISPECIES: DUF3558 family protein [Streptomyces]KOT55696.1 hypothetical protein ADK43_24755 [Streptomyces rimosus subsp. rimosus]